MVSWKMRGQSTARGQNSETESKRRTSAASEVEAGHASASTQGRKSSEAQKARSGASKGSLHIEDRSNAQPRLRRSGNSQGRHIPSFLEQTIYLPQTQRTSRRQALSEQLSSVICKICREGGLSHCMCSQLHERSSHMQFYQDVEWATARRM